MSPVSTENLLLAVAATSCSSPRPGRFPQSQSSQPVREIPAAGETGPLVASTRALLPGSLRIPSFLPQPAYLQLLQSSTKTPSLCRAPIPPNDSTRLDLSFCLLANLHTHARIPITTRARQPASAIHTRHRTGTQRHECREPTKIRLSAACPFVDTLDPTRLTLQPLWTQQLKDACFPPSLAFVLFHSFPSTASTSSPVHLDDTPLCHSEAIATLLFASTRSTNPSLAHRQPRSYLSRISIDSLVIWPSSVSLV